MTHSDTLTRSLSSGIRRQNWSCPTTETVDTREAQATLALPPRSTPAPFRLRLRPLPAVLSSPPAERAPLHLPVRAPSKGARARDRGARVSEVSPTASSQSRLGPDAGTGRRRLPHEAPRLRVASWEWERSSNGSRRQG